ncbi:MAG: site-specific integrase [Alphaproteobacteria bacterium]|nr:site-specific integrase [Alphaproteobacteria bacterium]
MTQRVGRLSSLTVARLSEPGLHHDGAGLNLRVARGGTRSWIFRYTLNGKARYFGLGPFGSVSLAEARRKAAVARQRIADGLDPVEVRQDERRARRLAEAKGATFDQCVERFLASHGHGWRNLKHRQQWANTLATYCGPVFGSLPVSAIDTPLVMKVLEKLWHEKPETASRVRQRIERVLGWATIQGLRGGANPAAWKNHLDHLLPARGKVRAVEHFAALDYAMVPEFMATLARREGLAALALRFVVLTACRTGEALGARWSEIDLGAKAWTVPGARMKASKMHRVPLVPETMKLLEAVAEYRESEAPEGFLFPGSGRSRSLSNMSLLMLLRRMDVPVTSHGFRASFKTWASEKTNFPNEIIEASLAHAVGNRVEQAYQRSDVLDRRRRLMGDWASFCLHGEPAMGDKIIPIGRAAT